MDNIRFYRHPAQSPHQGKSRQASKVIPDGVGNVVDDLILRQDMLAGEKVACVEESSRECKYSWSSSLLNDLEMLCRDADHGSTKKGRERCDG